MMSALRPLNILLVHGTWSDGIPNAVGDWLRRLLRLPPRKRPTEGKTFWYQRNHTFATQLEAGLAAAGVTARFEEPLLWAGANSFTARLAAADTLEGRLEALQGRTLVIGHSHGGSVVVQALHQMPPERAREIDVVTMGTPFVRVAACSTQALVAAPFAIGFCTYISAVYLWTQYRGVGIHDLMALDRMVTFSLMGLMALVLAFGGLAVVLAHWFERIRKRLATRFAGRHLHCLRGMSDEAGLTIAGGLIGSGLSRAVLAFVGLMANTKVLAVSLMLMAVALLSAAFGVWSSPLLERVAPTMRAGAAVVGGLLLLASLGNWFLGAEMALVGVFYVGGLDSTPDAPEGRLRVETVGKPQAATEGLRHSAFYTDPEVIAAIVAGVTRPDEHVPDDAPRI